MRLLVILPLLLAAGFRLEAEAQEGNAARFETYCSRSEPGNSVAEVQWPLAAEGNTADLSALARRQVLDITVYKDGFQRGLYATIKPGIGEREFRRFKPHEAKQIPGTQKLKVTQFTTSEEKPKQGLRLLMRPMPAQPSAVAKLEGLEPGMKYFVRASSPDSPRQTVSFTAAICPMDWVQPKGK